MAGLISAIVAFALILAPTTTTLTQRNEALTARAVQAVTASDAAQDPESHRWDATLDDQIADVSHAMAMQADALPIPGCEWTPQTRKNLSHMVLIESSRGTDSMQIAWTMARRWKAWGVERGTSFADYVVETSRPLRLHARSAERPRYARSITPIQRDVIADRSPRQAEVEAELDAWARGERVDPCDGQSFFWASPSHRRAMNTPRVPCGETANHFFNVSRSKQAEYMARVSEPLDVCFVDDAGSSRAEPGRADLVIARNPP
jgi:hypothetical protein